VNGHGPIENHALGKAVKGRSGRTPAAWTMTWIVLAAAVVMGVALIIATPWMFWMGLGIAAAGVLTGWIMSRAGLGLPAGYHQAGDVETRDTWVAEGPMPRVRSREVGGPDER
jgi:hypothetical protein